MNALEKIEMLVDSGANVSPRALRELYGVDFLQEAYSHLCKHWNVLDVRQIYSFKQVFFSAISLKDHALAKKLEMPFEITFTSNLELFVDDKCIGKMKLVQSHFSYEPLDCVQSLRYAKPRNIMEPATTKMDFTTRMAYVSKNSMSSGSKKGFATRMAHS
jgi:hypothetical protein